MGRLLIRRATVVFPDRLEAADVLCVDGKIVDVAASSATPADEVIDGDGLHLLPGVVDDQVHFRDPGLTHKEDWHTGGLAAAKGGVTTVLEMPNTIPNTIDQQAVDAKLAMAASKCPVNFGVYIGATPNNLDALKTAQRVAGIKIFIGSSTGDLLVDEQAALERIFAETTLPICAHCEDEASVNANAAKLAGTRDVADHSRIRDEEAAVIATRRACDLAHRHKHRFHVLHVSTAAELAIFADHHNLLTAEVCPHHLYFSTDDYARLGTKVQMNPSVKSPDNLPKLWDALASGAVQVVATDHAPHTLAEKAAAYPASPSGLPAVENSLALMLHAVHEGRLTLPRLVEAMCDAPARVWDLLGKGRIAEGYDADLVLVDLDERHTIRDEEQVAKSGWSPWHGTELVGRPVTTIVNGQVVHHRGNLDANHRGHPVEYDHTRGGYWSANPVS
jgi:dihydroorotase